MPARIEFKQKGFIRSKEFDVFADIKETITEVYVIPYLTNKRMYLLFLPLVKGIGPVPKWWIIPFDYIDNVKLEVKKTKEGKKVWVNVRLKIPKKGLISKSQTIDFRFFSANTIGWQTYVAKIVMFNEEIRKMQKRISELEGKLKDLDKKLEKGQIDSSAYRELSNKYKSEIEQLKEKIELLKNKGIE